MNRIKELRKSKKITQKELASHLGIADSTLSYWEQGRYEPDISALRQLSKFFNVSIDYIIGEIASIDIEVGKDYDISVNETKILYDVKLDETLLKRTEFENLSNEEVDKLAEYAEFLKSKRHKKSHRCEKCCAHLQNKRTPPTATSESQTCTGQDFQTCFHSTNKRIVLPKS